MAILRTLYNKIRDNYVHRLTEMEGDDFFRVLSEIVFFSAVKLEIPHIQQIFQKAKRDSRQYWFLSREGQEKSCQFWENILSSGKDSILKPNASRGPIVKKWLHLNWDGDTLSVIARQTREAEFRPAWENRIQIQRQKNIFPLISDEIAYEQLYHLAGSREEKGEILRSAWSVHFRVSLSLVGTIRKVSRAERMLEEHIRQFPEDIPGLRKTFYDLIMHPCDGKKRRAGWVGMAVTGAGEYEEVLLECLQVRIRNLFFVTSRDKKLSNPQSCIQPGAVDEVDEVDEIEGMTRWIPQSERNRQVLRQVLENLLDSPPPPQIHKQIWDGFVKSAIWKAYIQLEPSEERILENISSFPSSSTLEVLTDWQPRSPEIRGRLWQLLAENVLSTLVSEIEGDDYVYTSFGHNRFWMSWKGLIALDPEQPQLGTLLLKSLVRAGDGMFWDTVLPWLRRHGIPPGTPADVRRQLEEKILEPPDIPQYLPSRKTLYRQITEAAFYVLLYSPPDMDEKRQAWRENHIKAILEDTEILSSVTECMESQISPQNGRGLELVRAKWEEKLAALGHQTESGEKRAILEYFAHRARYDREFCPTDLLREKLLFLIREEKNKDIVILAARLGHHLAIHGDGGFFMNWVRTVQEREMSEWNGMGRKLHNHLNLIRQEALLQLLSGYLDSELGEQTPLASVSARSDKAADWRLLRELFRLFPEAVGDGKRKWDSPARVWPEETVCIIKTGGEKKKKSEEAPETPEALRIGVNNRCPLVFGTVPGGDGGQLSESHRQMAAEPSISEGKETAEKTENETGWVRCSGLMPGQ